MKSINAFLIMVSASVAVILTGCSDEKMPEVKDEKMLEVNEINCQKENILKIKDKAMQQDFASKCFRRGGFKPSPKREW